MKKQITILLIASVALTACNSSSNSSDSSTSSSTEGINSQKTPEELKADLLAQEQNDPLKYLTVDGSMQADEIKTRDAGLFHDAEYSPDGNTIYGTITNSATIAKFKDVVLTVTYYSQTETAIESKDFTFYEFYNPNSTSNFELKVYPPETMSKFSLEIKSATPIN